MSLGDCFKLRHCRTLRSRAKIWIHGTLINRLKLKRVDDGDLQNIAGLAATHGLFYQDTPMGKSGHALPTVTPGATPSGLLLLLLSLPCTLPHIGEFPTWGFILKRSSIPVEFASPSPQAQMSPLGLEGLIHGPCGTAL